jgi:hypothetical protein
MSVFRLGPACYTWCSAGAVRLTGSAQLSVNVTADDEEATSTPLMAQDEEAFLGFVGPGQPFEIIAQSPFSLQSFAHVDQTAVIWLYWHDLDNWPHFRREVLEAFRHQHQRKLLWLSTLGQRRTIDRLIGFLTLLIEEFGETSPEGYYLPFPSDPCPDWQCHWLYPSHRDPADGQAAAAGGARDPWRRI